MNNIEDFYFSNEQALISEITQLLDRCHWLKIMCSSIITIWNLEHFNEFPFPLSALSDSDSVNLLWALSPWSILKEEEDELCKEVIPEEIRLTK